MYPVRFSLTKSTISCIIIFLFGYIVLHANQFHVVDTDLGIHQKFVSTQRSANSSAIHLNAIELVPIEASDSVTKHVVRRGETLSSIASKYGTTISKIKEINLIQGNFLRVGQEIFVTDVPGIIHNVKENTNFLVFANKYELSLEDIMTLNYVTNEETLIEQGSEIFLPISIEKAYDLGIEEKPKPKPQPRPQPQKVIAKQTAPVVAPKPTPVPAAPAPQATATAPAAPATVAIPKPAANPVPQQVAKATGPYAGKIEAKWRDGSTAVSNGFYKGYCTYWAAKKRPDIFPYTSPTTQSRPFGGNAKHWLTNATNAGYPTGYSPSPGAIAVFAIGGAGYYSYGHVGIVMKVDRDNGLFLMEEMNGPAGKGWVNQRWVSIKDSNILGYIY